MGSSRPQESIYSKRITSYGTPISDNALSINTYSAVPNNAQNPAKIEFKSSPKVHPLNDEYKPVPATLPLDKSAADRSDYKHSKVRPAIIHKHVYVHIPPPDEEETTKTNPDLPPVHKHYKIIFIQTPTPKTTHYNLQIPRTEEKTIVYVLVKKTDEISDDVPSSVSPPITSKPEVYYIRYKTKEEAINTISNAAKDTFGYVDEAFDKVGKKTGIISGGSISDALLGAGSFADLTKEGSTEEATTVLPEGTTFDGY